MSARGYIWLGVAAFDLWFWIEFVKIAMGIWKYCYCGIGI